jgi:RNA polymerase sigma factor (sigma-70 family)
MRARSTGQQAELGAVVSSLRLLPEIDRAALLMRALHGLPYQEIAVALGISVSAARVKVHRARASLMKLRMPPRESLRDDDRCESHGMS